MERSIFITLVKVKMLPWHIRRSTTSQFGYVRAHSASLTWPFKPTCPDGVEIVRAEKMLVLSNAEERTLVRRIRHLITTGFPASHRPAVGIAEGVRHSLIQLSSVLMTYPGPHH